MTEAPRSAEAVARDLADGLDRRGIAYAIGGALALNRWAAPRGTKDLDLNIWVDKAAPTQAAHLLGALGCTLNASAVIRSFEDKGHAYARYEGVRVDVYLPTNPFHESVRARRKHMHLEGRDAWFLSAEDLAVFKMIIFRPKDLVDVESLLVVQGRAFDRDYARMWLTRLVGAQDVRTIRWDELAAAADATLKARDQGFRPDA